MSTERIDELIIVVFINDYKLKEFYQIPWQDAILHIKLRGKVNPRNELNWSSVKDYKVGLHNLPHQEIVRLFR